MRVLMLSPHPGVRSPLTTHTPLLVTALRQLGCDVVSEPWGRHREDEPVIQKFVSRASDAWVIRRMLLGDDFDVVVVKTALDWMSLLRDLMLLVLTTRSEPCRVIQLHGGNTDLLDAPGHRLFKIACRMLFRLSDGVLVLAASQDEEIRRFRPGTRVRTVDNPFVPATPPVAATRPPHKDVPVLLFASRLLPAKGIFETIEAAAILSRRVEFRLLIAGSGPAERDVEQAVRDAGLTDRVEVAGHLDRDALSAAYHSADVFVLPTYYPEGFPTVVAEAMGAGLPLVVTRNRGLADHLQDGVNALFVEEKDVRGLAATLERILSDAELRRRMSIANLAKIDDFSPGKVASRYLEALESLCARHRGAAAPT
jgi:glycosyltransferase involved in cell wall biosynthesis